LVKEKQTIWYIVWHQSEYKADILYSSNMKHPPSASITIKQCS